MSLGLIPISIKQGTPQADLPQIDPGQVGHLHISSKFGREYAGLSPVDTILAGPIQVGISQVARECVDLLWVGHPQIGTAQVGPKQVGTIHGPIPLGYKQIGPD